MSEEGKESKGFVFIDRRRFDDQGNEREAQTDSKPAEVTPKPKPAEPKVATASPERPATVETTDVVDSDAENGEINFSSFIMSLATQALMQLGEISAPPGMQMEVDVAAARQSIDIIAMLQNKTKGNLGKEEAHILEQILHNLRISYVKASSVKK